MQVELIGSTCAGKSTLARKIMDAGRKQNIDVSLSDDFVLKGSRLNWIKNEFLRRRLIELLAFAACLVHWREHEEFYRFAIQMSLRVPGSWWYKFNVARNTLRKVGIYNIVRRRSSGKHVVLLDNEGVLQASHTLFVHVHGAAPDTSSLSTFVSLAPLPTVVVYLRQGESVLIERTIKRGHNRIARSASREDVERFIRRAIDVFDELERHPLIADRLLVIDGERSELVVGEHLNNAHLAKAAALIRLGLDSAP